jgi:hypothetical protein
MIMSSDPSPSSPRGTDSPSTSMADFYSPSHASRRLSTSITFAGGLDVTSELVIAAVAAALLLVLLFAACACCSWCCRRRSATQRWQNHHAAAFGYQGEAHVAHAIAVTCHCSSCS